MVALAEQRHIKKQAEIEKKKIRIIASGGGRKPEMSPKEGICLCLVYLRQKPIFEILGLLFDVSKTKAGQTQSRPILKTNEKISISRLICFPRPKRCLRRATPTPKSLSISSN
ncbi:MAG: transposase family protein [Nostoc sp. NMS1]|uniref:transposase family protein n=1 Tax=unclassified Nostoc TaxID=2593658 RepID=UPI0025EA6E14|nr:MULTISPECIES: transposase family protein [unclassified Nostoc]MBN3911495.1 transposase family protein [Nostoc sp. NMS1]MBN3991988.1 transposase family protein [Nostoc sp. NMS2]